MGSRSLLLLLLVLACLQSFTTAENGNGPTQCCFRYQKHKIPVKIITGYKITEQQCTQPGVIFTVRSGRRVCADPGAQWVKSNMEKINLIAQT